MRETCCIFFAFMHWWNRRNDPDSISSSRGWRRWLRLVGIWGVKAACCDTMMTILSMIGVHRYYEWSNERQNYIGRWAIGRPHAQFLRA